MSFNALLTDTPDAPLTCCWCHERIVHGDKVVCALFTEAVHFGVSYNDIPAGTMAVDIDWTEEDTFHLKCYLAVWEKAKP